VPEDGSTASVGRAYNEAVCEFVVTQWSIDRAALHAASLAAARRALRAFARR
jgi:hypothetical protein